jgi:hypothetical protein
MKNIQTLQNGQRVRKITHRTILGSWGAGWMTPQFQLQITPACWKFEFVIVTRDRIPVKVGLAVGPIAAVLFFGKASFGTGSGYNDTISSHFEKVEEDDND